MNKKEIYDWIRMHHSDMNETVLEKIVNRAMDDFCEKTEILKDTVTVKNGTVSNQRYYQIDEDVLNIKEMRINELPIPRIQDTGMIDSTVPTGSTITDIGGSVDGGGGTEIDNTLGPQSDIIEQAAYFNNYNGNKDGSVNRVANAPAKYIDFADTLFAEIDGRSQCSLSVWVKFDNAQYHNTGTIFNNYGTDPSNGRFGMYFTGLDTIKKGGWTKPLKHFLSNSFQTEFSTDDASGQWSEYDSGSGISINKHGVAHRGFTFEDMSIANNTKGRVENQWFLLTMSFDGTSGGQGLRFYINNHLNGTHHTPFFKQSSSSTSPYFGRQQHWSPGGQASTGQGVVKTKPGSGQLYYGSTYTKWSTFQLGATLHPGDEPGDGLVDVANIYGSNMGPATNNQSERRRYIPYAEGAIVYPFSGHMRNFMLTNHAITPEDHLSLYYKGITDLTGVKTIIAEANIKHFYGLKSDANDEVGSINGTVKNGLTFEDTTITTTSNTRGNR